MTASESKVPNEIIQTQKPNLRKVRERNWRDVHSPKVDEIMFLTRNDLDDPGFRKPDYRI